MQDSQPLSSPGDADKIDSISQPPSSVNNSLLSERKQDDAYGSTSERSVSEYVLCYASVPWVNSEYVLLIRKNKPSWQAGRLNLPGGKVEIWENVLQAATREMFEETGLRCSEGDVTNLGSITGPGFLIHCCYCEYAPVFFDRVNDVEYGKTEEEIAWYDLPTVLKDPTLMPNLRVIIPLMKHKVGGWVMESVPEIGPFTLRFVE